MSKASITLTPQEAATILSALSAAINKGDISPLLEAQRLVARAVVNSPSHEHVAELLGKAESVWLRRPVVCVVSPKQDG